MSKFQQVTVSLPRDLRKFVMHQAERADRTVAGQIRHFVAEAARRLNGTGHTPPSPWISATKERIAAMEAEQARLSKVESADAEARVRQLGLDLYVLRQELAVAERLLAPSDDQVTP